MSSECAVPQAEQKTLEVACFRLSLCIFTSDTSINHTTKEEEKTVTFLRDMVFSSSFFSFKLLSLHLFIMQALIFVFLHRLFSLLIFYASVCSMLRIPVSSRDKP